MEQLTYKQAYDKIINAYFNDDIEPLDAKFCFCGNLDDNTDEWYLGVNGGRYYFTHEYQRMERALFDGMDEVDTDWGIGSAGEIYENALFNGMAKALEVLKEIHRERGEDVDGFPALPKRELKDERGVTSKAT